MQIQTQRRKIFFKESIWQVLYSRPSVDLPPAYISAFNDMVKRYSEEAAITLLNLPVPPEDAEGDADKWVLILTR